MDKTRYLVEAHLLEGRSVSELAAAHAVHRSWIYKLLARYREGGYEALEPRSRAPRSSPSRTSAEIVLRRADDRPPPRPARDRARPLGLDDLADPASRGAGGPPAAKRPRCSLIRFEAELPNEMWQADITHWRLADGRDVEILSMIDDHSRLFLASRAFPTARAADVAEAFRSAIDLHGTPASLLCDNGAVFTAIPRGGKVLLQVEMERLGVVAKNSRPYHPQTCGKVERLHQTLKRFLARQALARTLIELQCQLDAFVHYYNAIRPHRALGGRTPLQAYSARIKARPLEVPEPETHFRIRHDKVDTAGTVTLRYDSKLHHIGLGRAHKGKPVKLLTPTATSASSTSTRAS